MTPKTNKRLNAFALAATALAFAAPLASAQNNDQDSEVLTAPAAPAQAPVSEPAPVNETVVQASDQVALDPGTVIPVTLNMGLTSNKSQAGDVFTATVDTTRDAYKSILRGATVDGVVRHATPRSGSDPGTLELAFTRLHLPNGETYPIAGTVTSLDTKDLQVGSDGVLRAVKVNKDQSATYAGIGAGAGAIVGILTGGKVRFEDLLLGGGLGYAAGQLLKNTQQVHDVTLKPGMPVGVLLGERVLYHRSALKVTRQVAPAVAAAPKATPEGSRRYYSYQGHPYYLDLKTGKRVRLD